MTTLGLLFALGQALTLASLVYFLHLLVWWRLNRPANLQTAERRADLRPGEEHPAPGIAMETAEAPRHREIAAA